MSMPMSRHCVTNGLTGIGKTEEALGLALQVATRYNPVLFAYKDYQLLRENRDKLIHRYGVAEKEICVCGTSKTYEEALASYTNPDKPRYMEPMAKYILCTQACLQRKGHETFVSAGNHKTGFSLIVVDEVDYDLLVVPTLRYQLSRIKHEEVKTNTVKDIITSARIKYSKEDVDYLLNIENTTDKYKNFFISKWLKDSNVRVMFLTSETLPVRFLKHIGAKDNYLPSPDYKHCVINTFSTKLLVSEFYEVMNDNDYWEEFRDVYDLVVSDKHQKQDNTLQSIDVLNHTVVRGTNNYRNKRLLTILSHVPMEVLSGIKDIFHDFGDPITDKEVYQSYYSDRLCQAVGRVLGNRGSVETDLLINKYILDVLVEDPNFPYGFKTDWIIPHTRMDEILTKTKKLKEENKEKRKKYEEEKLREKVEKTYNELDKHFIKRKDSYIASNELGEYLRKNAIKSKYGKENLPVKHVAKYFDVEIKRLTINKKRTVYVVGLDYANRVTREITEA